MKQYFKLMHHFFNKKIKILTQKGAKITYIGDITPFPKNLQKRIKKVVKDSKQNKNITINIAINYTGRDEIMRAINKLLESRSDLYSRKGRTLKDSSDKSHPRKLTSKKFESFLDTKNLPDPDLLIRTGENNQRLSSFMLWQIAYTQLYFTDTLFPDFQNNELDQAIKWYQTQTQNLGQ